jgi:hypothetical protein
MAKMTAELDDLDLSKLTKVGRQLVIEGLALGWVARNVGGHKGGVNLISTTVAGQMLAIPGGANMNAAAIRSAELKLRRYAVPEKLTEWLRPRPAPRKAPAQQAPPPKEEPEVKEPEVTTIKSTAGKFKAEVKEITPDLAMDWLTNPKYKVPNRSIRKTKVRTYASAMRNGRWRVTGEAIKFDEDGKLIDGQHRLNAVIEADVTISSLVITGVENGAANVMDTGAARDAKDVLNINGYDSNGTLAAAVRIVVAYQTGMLQPNQAHPIISNEEILDWVNEHQWSADLHSELATPMRRIPTRSSVWLAAMILVAHQSRDSAIEFTSKMSSGSSLETNNPVLTLRERFIQVQANKERHPPYVLLSAILRAYVAWQKGQHLAKIVFYRGDEPVKIPDSL